MLALWSAAGGAVRKSPSVGSYLFAVVVSRQGATLAEPSGLEMITGGDDGVVRVSEP